MDITLIRGLPGSGKTTHANSMAQASPGSVTIESDQWFVRNGKYEFNTFELGNAHQWCVSECEFLIRKFNKVIVSNTFTTIPECAPYFVIAKKYEVPINLIIMTGQYKNVHGTPDDIIEKMRARFESNQNIINTLEGSDLLNMFYANPYSAYAFYYKELAREQNR